MLDTTELSKSSQYRIYGKSGDWKYSHKIPGARSKYVFWRFASKCPNTRVSVELSQSQVLSKVWECETSAQQPIRSFDITKLEAFSET
ncbi:hypothetical protein [Fischerella thermalis]|uniref:Uncharacterized protein n=1 Tax=Fischerella thermalis CCMEE 5318 TaxID=2019666 RepID=A0A2N6LC04_9CYAN|nr:hypothetical protein [Fischerella thermalis]PMB20271.1 hypothetical protein CEN46_16815 [Fischerella thermalis CCMEE 5318]